MNVQFWVRLASVSYRGKKARTVAFPVVRSVHKTRDTQNCVQNEPEYAICVIFTTRSYFNDIGLILCDLIWQIRHNCNCLDDGHYDVACHRKMSLLGSVGAMVTAHENSLIMWSFKGPKLFCVPQNLLEKWRTSRYGVVYKLNSVSNLSRISDWSVHSGSYFSIRLGSLQWVPTAYSAGRQGLNLLNAVRPVELAHWYQGSAKSYYIIPDLVWQR